MTEVWVARRNEGSLPDAHTVVVRDDDDAFGITRHPDRWGASWTFDEFDNWTFERWRGQYDAERVYQKN
jgi:hypothetical protein